MTESRLQKILYYTAVFLLLLFAFSKASWCASQVTQPDQGLFATFGYLITEGKTLYVDFFDHKPPGIYLLNALYIFMGGATENAVGYGLVFFAVIHTFVVFQIIRNLTDNDWAAFSGTIAFILIFFDFNLFGSGNFTEQYGAFFCSAAFLVFLLARKQSGYKLYFVSGALYALAFWFKEPFLLSALPVGLWLLVNGIFQSAERKNLLSFVSAWIPIAFLFLLWLYNSGALPGYLEHLQHSFEYTGHGDPLWSKEKNNYKHLFHYMHFSTARTLLLLGATVVLLLIRSLKQKVLLLVFGNLIAEYIATGLSGNDFHHYFMQFIPNFVIAISVALSSVKAIKKIEFPQWGSAMPVFIWAAGLAVIAKPWHNVRLSPEKRNWDEVAEYLEKNEKEIPRNIALGSQELGFCLLKNQGQSAMRYVVPYPFHWVIRDENRKREFLQAEYNRFLQNPPEYIIFNGGFSQLWIDAGIDTLAKKNYIEVTGNNMDHLQVILLKKK